MKRSGNDAAQVPASRKPAICWRSRRSDRSGVVVTREGAFVRILEVTPPNPFVMPATERARVADGFCYLVGRLRPEQSLQFYIDARPFKPRRRAGEFAARGTCLEQVRRPGPADGPGRRARALSRWRLYAAMEESLRLHADDQGGNGANDRLHRRRLHAQAQVAPATSETNCGEAVHRSGGPLVGSTLERDLRSHRRLLRESSSHTRIRSGSSSNTALAPEPAAERRAGRDPAVGLGSTPTSADLGRRPRPRLMQRSSESSRRPGGRCREELARRRHVCGR